LFNDSKRRIKNNENEDAIGGPVKTKFYLNSMVGCINRPFKGAS